MRAINESDSRSWADWESRDDDHNLLVKCVGYNYGPHPEQCLSQVRADRGGYGDTVAYRMRLNKEDSVLDLGSGCGFVGRAIAPQVKMLHCCDLSRSFLGFCRRELAEFANVECHLIGYADFSALREMGINKVYSTAVWIHFNFYDMVHYLTALRDLLPGGGSLYFDYADAEYLCDLDDPAFKQHAAGYRSDRTTIQTLLAYNSLPAVARALSLTGFSLEAVWNTWRDCRSVLAHKTA
jgi:hypothetical protein